MQPVTAPPRNGLTAGQVVDLLQGPGFTFEPGVELVDMSLAVLDDTLSDDLIGGSVARSSYATLHGTASLSLTRELDWGRALVRPYVTLDDGISVARFNLGVYYTSTPVRDLMEAPPTYTVDCFDVVSVLDDPVGDAYSVAAGVGYLAAAELILLERGVTAYVIDQAAVTAVLPAARVWMFDPRTRWLTIVNDLLGAIGYAGIWSDWDGRLRLEPYRTPRERAPEWAYTVDVATDMLGGREVDQDYYAAPNRWVFYRNNNVEGAAPVEGNGMYTFVNQSVGPSSVDARGGRVITREPVGLDVADHAALLAAAQRTIDADMQIPTRLAVSLPLANPLHWHFDRLLLDDPALGPPADMLCTQWTLPLDGGAMTQGWTQL